MEHVHLEARQFVNFVFQFLYAQERAAHIVHEAAHFERRPVRDGERFQLGRSFVAFGQLLQRLRRPDDPRGGQCLDLYGIRGDDQFISLVGEEVHLVVERPGYF